MPTIIVEEVKQQLTSDGQPLIVGIGITATFRDSDSQTTIEASLPATSLETMGITAEEAVVKVTDRLLADGQLTTTLGAIIRSHHFSAEDVVANLVDTSFRFRSEEIRVVDRTGLLFPESSQ